MHGDAQLTIPWWANGPGLPDAGTGNGGWTAGLLAGRLPAAGQGATVDLRVPPPIGRPLTVREHAASHPDGIGLFDEVEGEDVLVATAEPLDVQVEVPAAARAVGRAEAQEASTRFPFRSEHPFPHCVCCGVDRPADLPSLRVHCGELRRSSPASAAPALFAATWTPSPDVSDPADATIASVAACWSALDCPSVAPFAAPATGQASVLARLAVRLHAQARVGEPHVLVAWERGVQGRKQYSCSALLAPDGAVLGVADALWIELRA